MVREFIIISCIISGVRSLFVPSNYGNDIIFLRNQRSMNGQTDYTPTKKAGLGLPAVLLDSCLSSHSKGCFLQMSAVGWKTVILHVNWDGRTGINASSCYMAHWKNSKDRCRSLTPGHLSVLNTLQKTMWQTDLLYEDTSLLNRTINLGRVPASQILPTKWLTTNPS